MEGRIRREKNAIALSVTRNPSTLVCPDIQNTAAGKIRAASEISDLRNFVQNGGDGAHRANQRRGVFRGSLEGSDQGKGASLG